MDIFPIDRSTINKTFPKNETVFVTERKKNLGAKLRRLESAGFMEILNMEQNHQYL